MNYLLMGTIMFAMSAPLSAQWLSYPTPGIPRMPDGKPNLTVPAPRSADGRPDLSGLWRIEGLGHATNITGDQNPGMLPWAQALYKQRLETYGNDDPVVFCLPEGPRTGLDGGYPLRIIQSPNLLAILYEVGSYRQIFTDGRPLPKEPNPTWMGYSVGHWDEDTLVVETAGYNDKTWLDFNGHPHTEALHLTERLLRKDFGHIQLDLTFNDPRTYTKVWTVRMAMSFVPDSELLENVCLENERDHGHLVGNFRDDRTGQKKIARDILSGYAGTYDTGSFGKWVISLDGDQLMVELPDGGGKQELAPLSETSFIFQSFGGTVTFQKNPRGLVTDFVLTIVEGDFKAPKTAP